MEQRIFRKISLERLSSPEQLDRIMTVTSPKGWLALAAMLILIVTTLIWSIFGTIPTRVYGQGILMKSGGVRNVTHTKEGIITDIRVRPGDIVRPGDVIARVEQREQLNAILDMKEQLQNLSKDRENNKEKISELEKEIEKAREKLEFDSFVVSSYSGRVLEVKFNKGDMLLSGEPIISLELIGEEIKELEAIIYVPAEQGKRVYTGMEVQISPTIVNKEEYGFLIGRVISVSEYPSTRQGMISILGSDEMVDRLMGDSAPIEVRVDLVPDPNTESGYKWSSRQGPPTKINSGTLCEASITIEKEPPIKKVLQIR